MLTKTKQFLSNHKIFSLIFIFIIAFAVWAPTIYANLSTRSLRYDLARTAIKDVPHNHVGIVFGAGVYPSGRPTPYLQWRIDTAVQLYKAGRIDKLLMTGDNSTDHYDEPGAMARTAEAQGVPSKDIILDYAAR